jgi:hypothetical protein
MNDRLWSPQMRKWARDAPRHGIPIGLYKARSTRRSGFDGGGAGVAASERMTDDSLPRVLDAPKSLADGPRTIDSPVLVAGLGTPIIAGASTVMATAFLRNSGAAVTTTIPAPAHSLIVVMVGNSSNDNTRVLSVTDSVGNVYREASQNAPQVNIFSVAIFFSSNSTPLPTGGSITTTLNAGGAQWDAIAFYALGANGGLDQHIPLVKTSSVATFNTTSSQLATARELVVAVSNPTDAAMSPLTLPPGFVSLGAPDNVECDFAIVNDASPIVYNPSWPVANATRLASCLASFRIG